ncbi:hypothetical protein N7452_000995 [Penicillium brevicompactum]|uniref:Short-chain dehydrogenase n=1 Tax=Penicillium brevicompactum TaxID=5074 RepID=A0A9W9R1K5_PENBR|nr:hypothetical protein N7452_000995 [Penicillium brevicompactum]
MVMVVDRKRSGSRICREDQGTNIDGGIGAETALCLASQSPSTIILAGRDRAKIQPVIEKISHLNPEVNAIFITLDLSSQASVRSAAAEVNRQVDHLDVLINNAALMACPYGTTPDNLEIQFGTNFIGPFLFTGLLLPRLRAAGPGARIVNVSSSAHRFESIRFDDVDFKGGSVYDTWKAYGQSKTALILMAVHIASKLPSTDIAAFAVHPGSIASNLQRHVDSESISDARVKSQNIVDYEVTDRKSLQQGCSTTLIAALDPSLTELSGSYLSDGQLKDPARHASGTENATKLWNLGEAILGQTFEL